MGYFFTPRGTNYIPVCRILPLWATCLIWLKKSLFYWNDFSNGCIFFLRHHGVSLRLKQHSLDLPWQTDNNAFLEWVVFCLILVKMCFFLWKFLWNAIEKFRQIWILYGRTEQGSKMMNFYRKEFFLNCVWKEIHLNFQQKSNNLTKMRLSIHCSKNLTLLFCTHETKECFYYLE